MRSADRCTVGHRKHFCIIKWLNQVWPDLQRLFPQIVYSPPYYCDSIKRLQCHLSGRRGLRQEEREIWWTTRIQFYYYDMYTPTKANRFVTRNRAIHPIKERVSMRQYQPVYLADTSGPPQARTETPCCWSGSLNKADGYLAVSKSVESWRSHIFYLGN
jgi:hypothetical protein